MAEKQNANIINTMRKYINETQDNWHLILPTVLLSLRSTPCNETSGFSPHHMLFGREMNIAYDVDVIPWNKLNTNAKAYLKDLTDHLQIIHEMAKSNSELAQDVSKDKHDQKAKESDFHVGELVLMQIKKVKPGLKHKLGDQWKGPYLIREKGPHNTYKLTDMSTHKLVGPMINAKHIKRYYNPDDYRPVQEPQPDPVLPEPDPILAEPDPVLPENDPILPHQANTQTDQHKPASTYAKSSGQKKVNTGNSSKTMSDEPLSNTKPRPVPDNDGFYNAKRILKQRNRGKSLEYWVTWHNNDPPAWTPSACLHPDLKHMYYETHTKQGKRRRRRQMPSQT
ncbi:MAG: hypothetical protein AB2693_25730 [Candidatus Thiodiazotropha sp.]